MVFKPKDKTETDAEVKKIMNSRRNQDLKEVINLVLNSPLKNKGEIVQVDGVISLEELSKSNTDVQTRIIMQMAKDAAIGEVRSAEFLMKYAGKEPPKQQQITMDLPTIIDDMTYRTTPVVASAFAAKMDGDEEEDEGEEEGEEEDI